MSNPCKDCVQYKTIKRPEFFVMGVDTININTYYVPVNDAISIGGLNEYYDNYTDWFTDASPTYVSTRAAHNLNLGVFDSIEDAISHVNTAASAYPTIDMVEVSVANQNYGNELQTDPSFLFWKYEYLQKPYSSLKDPTWNISFPICTTNNKFETNKEWKLKDCGIWKISYRLRVRPVIPMTGDEPHFKCADFGVIDGTESYDYIRDLMRFYKSLEAQEGSKAMGIAPMRIETGIYSHDTLKYKPVVWSDGNYPQILPNDRRYWSSKYPKEMYLALYNSLSSYTEDPDCPRQKWFVPPPEDDIVIEEDNGDPNEEEILYLYNDNITSVPGVGRFIPGTNSLTNPGTLKFSITDLKGGSSLIDWIDGFDYTGNGSKIAEMQIEIQGKVNGVWITSTILEYYVSTIGPVGGGTRTFTLDSNSQNPKYEDNIGSGYSSTQFYNFDSIDTRYSITINNTIPGQTVQSYNAANVVSKTFTPLTEDFVVELEGFTHVNLDKDKEVSIYLKVLPEHNDHGSGGINPVNIDLNSNSAFVQPWYSTVGGNSNVNVAVAPSGTWPWAPLSVDERTGYQEQLDVKYEPFLSVDQYWDGREVYPNRILTEISIRRGLGPSINTKGWYIMIEEGWVRAEKVCEDCEDC